MLSTTTVTQSQRASTYRESPHISLKLRWTPAGKLPTLNLGKEYLQLSCDAVIPPRIDRSYECFKALAALTLFCRDREDKTTSPPEDKIWQRLLRESQLEDLTVRMLEVRWERTIKPSFKTGKRIIDELLAYGKFEHLTKLRIIGPPEKKPGLLGTQQLGSFLDRHQDTLTEVVLANVILVDESTMDNVGDTMLLFANDMQFTRKAHLTKFEWTVDRRDEHPAGGCWSKEERSCNGTCRSYLVDDDRWVGVPILEDLARALRVELKDGK